MTTRSVDAREPGARLGALPWLLGTALAAFAFRGLFLVDSRLFDADGLLEWFTWPTGLWFPLLAAGAGWLAWRRLAGWRRLPKRRDRWLAGTALLGACAAMLWSRLTGVADLQVWSVAFAAAACALWHRGGPGLRRMALPILFLGLALTPPARLVGESLWWIQSLSARAATALVHAAGSPVLGESIALSTPDEVFGIVESCAALGVLLALTVAALLLRERVTDVGPRSWLLVLLAPPVALAVNLARITSIVLHPELNQIHHLGQWAVLLLLGGAALLGVTALLARSRAAARGDAALPPLARSPGRFPIAVLVGLSALSLIRTPEKPWSYPDDSARKIPAQGAGWRSVEVPLDRKFLGFVQFREVTTRRYQREHEVVDLFVGDAHHRSQWTSPFSPKTLLLGFRWVPVAAPDTTPPDLVRAPDQSALVAMETDRWWVAQWRFGDPGVLRESLRQLLALDASPFSTPRLRRVVRIAAPVDRNRADAISAAQAAVSDFARAFEAELFDDPS